jgi:hypothetical protein
LKPASTSVERSARLGVGRRPHVQGEATDRESRGIDLRVHIAQDVLIETAVTAGERVQYSARLAKNCVQIPADRSVFDQPSANLIQYNLGT